MQTSPADPPGGWRQVGLAFCHDVAMAGLVVVPPVIYARMAADLAIAPHTVASVLPFTRDLVSMLFYLPAARLMERIGVRRCSMVGTAIACIAAVVISTSASLALFAAMQARTMAQT